MANDYNTIGLCMIVKNEANLIRRCLASALPLVDYILVVDTGSTDGTQQIVCDFLEEHGIPGAVIDEPWRDFAYNRSFALLRLREVPGIDYALMLDADDVLVLVPGFDVNAFKVQMRHDHYDVLVDEGAVTHFRGHICSNRLPYAYEGVLHEYLDAPPGERGHTTATGISIHASRGGARSQNPRKYHDDAAVLEQALATETDPGLVSRYTFYLAQSYRDAGRLDDAAKAYAKRAEMGGWEEEAWHARLAEARCLRDLKDEGGFVSQALAAFSQRPHRAEPLYDLARHHRDRGRHEAAALFAERGLGVGRPESDTLFVEDFVYKWGLQEEYSIAANYVRDPARKDRGFAACNWLALNRDVPDGARGLARHNLRFYVEPAAKLLPSFAARPVGFTPPEGWHPMNPSVARRGDEIVMVQRTVNFVLEGGEYRTPGDGPVETRNFLLRLDAALAVTSSVEILPPIDLPPPRFGLVLGFEDIRLFAWQGALWCIAVLCELTQEGWRQQVLARIDERGAGPHRLVDWRVLEPPGPRRHEKNWMPLVEADPAGTGVAAGGERLRFLYLCDPTRIVDEEARTVAGSIPAIAAEEFRGGSQAIEFAGGRLALVHEVGFSGANNKERLYHHRFVWFDDTYALRGVSRPFIFERPGIEFAAGLAWHPDGQRLIISYGVGDGTAWLATVDANEVRAALLDAARLPSAAPTAADEAAERFLGAESLATPPADGGRLSLHAEETVSVVSPPEGEPEVAVEPETPLAPNPAPAVGPVPTEQDAQQSDQPPTLVLGSFGAEDFESQHALRPARDLHAHIDAYPRVLLAILAKQKERPLPLYLNCIEGLDYPKSAIFLYVRTNNNTDRTEQILREWVERVGPSYAGVEFDAEPVAEPVEQVPPHEWNSTRFRVLGHIRNVSLQKTIEHGCDFYFVCDADNFIRSCTLKELVALNLPIAAPFLRVTNPTHAYSNFFAKTDAAGFFAGCDEYQWITHRWVRGVVEVPVVHCTYLVRSDVIPELHYLDGSDDWEFAVFCKSAREAGIPQYLDNRQVYGYITFDPESNATKVNVAGGESDQIGFARTELEEVDGPKLSDTLQLPNESPEELKRRFSEIYERQQWGPGSGVGAAPDKTVEYRAFLQQFMARNRIRSVVDLGCGDWQFSRLIDWTDVRYLGVDVVPAVIEKNRRDFGSDTIQFEIFESLEKLPRADLLLCKDVLQHLPNNLVKEYLAAFRRNYKFALITNDEEPAEIQNTDIDAGGWRTLRLDREPFCEPRAAVLSWPVPWRIGGTIKSTYLLGDESCERMIAPGLAEHPSPGVNVNAATTDMLPRPSQEVAAPAARLIFLHSSWRASSTWFWTKFRPFPQTVCYYDVFNEQLLTIVRDQAAWVDSGGWDSRHPPHDPYYLEYLPLIEPTGGVQLFDRSIPLDWFVPVGGLRGELRDGEIRYLAMLIDHARQEGKIPVLGATSSLGRLWAIRNSFGGFHIFGHRNLWTQWLSYLYYRRRSITNFYGTSAHLLARSEDPFLASIADFYIRRALDFGPRRDDDENHRLSNDERLRLLHSLPENYAFAMFMALQIYLYLHAQLGADLTVDITQLARDNGYRSRIENELARQTGLEISLSDVIDGQRASGVAIAAAAIDWDEVRKHARLAVETLSEFGDPTKLMENATEFIDSAIAEMLKSKAALALRSDADKEIWYARLHEARCHWALGDDNGFVRQTLDLCNQRPDRAEPLFDLARFHRQRGMHEQAAHFAEAGLALERPGDDAEFVEDLAYRSGLQEELSIAAFYSSDPARKDRGFAACNWLALNRDVTASARDQARRHLRFYVVAASELMLSFTARPVGFSPPEGWHATNPSVAGRGDETVILQRVVNYILDRGSYVTRDGAPITTRNFLLRLNSALDVESSVEILQPTDLPLPVYGLALGFEDARLFVWHGALWCSATLRQLTPEGWCQQVLARIEVRPDEQCQLADWRALAPGGPPRHEKNWMPLVKADVAATGGETLRFIYLCDPTRLVDDTARVISETTPPIAAEQFRGGTQAIDFDNGRLALIHEEVAGATFADRAYHHRFVWFDDTSALRRVSRPFYLQKHGIEFAAGLAWHPDATRLIVSFGVGDREAWIATVDAAEVRAVLEDAERLPSGAPSQAGGNTVAIPRQLPALRIMAPAAFPIERPCGSSGSSTLPIHVINLDRTPARLTEFYRRNPHLPDVERFRAIDGRGLNREKLIRDGVITGDCIYTAGNLGCAMSHIGLWRKVVKEGHAITVAEDDAIFSRNFVPRSKEFLERLPEDWDFVQWGWVFQYRVWVHAIPQILNATMIFDVDQLRRHIADFQSHDMVPAPIRLRHSFGTVCYSVSPKGARALLEHCRPLSGKLIEFPGFGVIIDNKGIDCMMNGAYPSLKAFISMPPLVVTEHREEETTTREGGVDRLYLDDPSQTGGDGAQVEERQADAPVPQDFDTQYTGVFFDSQAAGSLKSARLILQELFPLYRPGSVIDIGCGVGSWLRAAGEFGVDDVFGIDGEYVPREKLLISPENFHTLDLENGNLKQAAAGRRFDLVICVEVAEHLSPERAPSFIDELCALGDAVLFSAAVPGQGGTGHVNERWPDYWNAHFVRNGFASFDHLRRRLWDESGVEFWYLQNVLVFARRGTPAFEVFMSTGSATPSPRPLIHPRSGRAGAVHALEEAGRFDG